MCTPSPPTHPPPILNSCRIPSMPCPALPCPVLSVKCQPPLRVLSPHFPFAPAKYCLRQLQPQPAGSSCSAEEISHSIQLLFKAWHSNCDSSHLQYDRQAACIQVNLLKRAKKRKIILSFVFGVLGSQDSHDPMWLVRTRNSQLVHLELRARLAFGIWGVSHVS